MTKSVLAVCAAVLVLSALGAPAAQPQAAASSQKTLDEKIEELRKAVKTTPDETGELAARPAAAQAQPPPAVPAEAPAGQVEDFRRVPLLNGIIIVRDLKEFNPEGVPLTPGLTVTNNALLETPRFKRLVLRYLYQPLNETRMRELQREIVLYYRAHDRPLVDVLYPEQDVSNGMLQIIVIEGRLKEIKVQDKDGFPYTTGWSGEKFLRESIRLQSNQVISESRLLTDLEWLNRNPFREVTAVYEPDPTLYGLTSVQLRVDEQRQWSADIGYENSGNPLTSENRMIAGATWGKAFGLKDHQLRYAFTTDPSFQHLRVNAISYYAPLPWRHGIRLIGYHLYVKAEPDSGVTTSGRGYQASMRYEVPLPAIHKYRHEAAAGLDFKNQDNSLFFGSTEQNTPTDIFQLAASYSAVLPDKWGRSSFSAQGYYSPGGVTDLNTDEDFRLARQGAEASYLYARFSFERVTRLLWDFSWVIQAGAEISNEELLPSEQLGMGGYATVRGYVEREGNGDRGFFVRNELRAPAFSLISLFSKKGASLDDKLQFLGFMDYGQVAGVSDVDIPDDDVIPFWSIGAGLRYACTRHFALRFDYGWQLKDNALNSLLNSSLNTGQSSRAHLGVVMTF